MAIALVGTPTTAAGSSTTATTVSITVPTGSTGDLLLIGVSCASQPTAGSTSPLITASSANTVRIAYLPGALVSLGLYYRVVQAGDPTSYSFTVNAGSPLGAVCVRYSGVDSTTLFRHWNVLGNLDGGSITTTSGTFPVRENVQSTDLAVVFVAMGTSVKATTQATALSTPASWTKVVSLAGATNSVTSAYRTVGGVYSRSAGTDAPSVTGAAGQYGAVSVVLIDGSSPVRDVPGGTISFVNAATVASVATGAANVSVSLPSGVVDGHFMLLVAGQSAGFGQWTVPAGWISIGMGSGRSAMGTTSFVSDIVSQAWYKFASGEPASYTVSFTGAGGVTQYTVAIVAYSGVRNPYPIDLTAVTNSTGAAATTTVAPYVLPQVGSDNLVVNCYTEGADTTGTFTMTGPSSPWNQRAQIISAVTTDFNAAVIISDKLAATDQPTATVSKSGMSTVFSLTLVGIPGVSNVWRPTRGPSYRR